MIFESGSTQLNLDSFLHCTTPTVKSQFLPKSEIRNLSVLWHPCERENIEYFTLGDLWNCYDEWSAYGAGVPIGLDNNETLVQYYVPYLSVIQIFTFDSSVSGLREEIESGDGERDSFSDSFSDESELWRSDGCSSEDGGSDQDSLWHVNNRLGLKK
ncbi:Detected protein of confused Function [Hibiscus syriacus]|uniref:Detected protein of confused Function n=1 Tax=Hibiscus syriacus TaxID=106335 RepID=A0A6A3ACW3_HIBSY|nr:Detected protein of confused Function [Hibiscus syriacus]